MITKSTCLRLCGLVYLMLFAFSSAEGNSLFHKAKHYTTGNSHAESVAVGDLNGDGRPDVVTTNTCVNGPNGCFGVLLGTGNGMFQYSNSYDSGGYAAQSIALRDVNGDGKLDVLIANADNTGVLLGNGDGTFQPAQTYGFGADYGDTLAVADVNGDGKLDLFTTRYAGVEGLLGNGDGTFQAPQQYPAGEGVKGIAVHDVDGDGKADLIVVDDCLTPDNCDLGAVGVLLGNGDGTFQALQLYSTGGMASTGLFVGDVNGDNKADALVTNMNDNNVAVLLGNGDGTFQTAHTYDSGGGFPVRVVAADVNGDGNADVVVTNPFDNYYYDPKKSVVGVLLGNGDGTFQSAQTFRTGGIGAVSTAVGDLNGDSMPDLAIVNECDTLRQCSYGLLGVLINRTKGFVTSTALSSSLNPSNYGQAVTFTATVSSAGPTLTGKVKFLDGTTGIGTVALSGGVATLTKSKLAVGTHPITAQYLGDAANDKSTSSVLYQVVQ